MTDLAPYEPAQPPAPRSGGDGPLELWRRANAATKGTVIGVLLVLVVAGSFFAGRLTAPGDDDGGGRETASGTTTTRESPADLAQARRDDATAKTVARDVVTFVESCAAVSPDQSYARCRTGAQLNVGSTLPLVDTAEPAAGQVAVAGSRDGYRIVSISASGNSFTIAKEGTAEALRTCTDGGAANAGCVGGVW